MDEYYFIYKDSLSKWYKATNLSFIASHKYCRAVPKACVSNIYELLAYLNNDEVESKFNQIVKEYDLQ